jgi:nucleotide-binding universal stress UspA family protein
VETATQRTSAPEAGHLFTRVLVGVDRSPESGEAARQAAVLLAPGGAMAVLAAWTLPPPTIGVVSPETLGIDEAVFREAAENAVSAAIQGLTDPLLATKVVRGFAWDELIKAADANETTLVVVGSHGQGRMRGIVMGSTATAVVHRAQCSVLIARGAGDDFPRRIVVGVDGSPEAAAAYAVAREIARRFGSQLWPVVAHGGDGLADDAVARIVDYHHEDSPDEPVEALVAASADADLLVVGSRGLHGLKALGSVSERVAHRARCSTLIVRNRAVEEPAR